MDLSDESGAHSSALLSLELALDQGPILRGSAEELGAGPMNHPKMSEVPSGQLQHTEVVAQGGSRASKRDGVLPAEHPGVGTVS